MDDEKKVVEYITAVNKAIDDIDALANDMEDPDEDALADFIHSLRVAERHLRLAHNTFVLAHAGVEEH